jgi:hypothetical protein
MLNDAFHGFVWGAHAPSRAGDRAPAIENFRFGGCIRSKEDFGEGAEIDTRGACAPQNSNRITVSDFGLIDGIPGN